MIDPTPLEPKDENLRAAPPSRGVIGRAPQSHTEHDAIRPRLSVVLPTARAWPAVREALSALMVQRCDEEFEVLLLDGDGAALETDPTPPVRWLRSPGADCFALRAQAIVAARGEIVAFSEDHCVVPPDWCARILAVHDANPAEALIGPIANDSRSARRAVDRANFLLTMGPFAPPLLALTAERLPIPTNLSVKRSALPSSAPEPGWLEYGFLEELRRRDQLGLAPDAGLTHVQSWRGMEALSIHFHSGRSYGASMRTWPRRAYAWWFLMLPALPFRLFRMNRPPLERGAAGAPPRFADRFWLMLLILSNAAGQFVGAVLGPGKSRRSLI